VHAENYSRIAMGKAPFEKKKMIMMTFFTNKLGIYLRKNLG
jgi:hypothetical protein